MNQRVFWVIIEAAVEAHPTNRVAQEKFIQAQLKSFDLEALLLFQVFCEKLMNGLCTKALFIAAYVLQEDYTEDWFKEFRAWLIGQGERAYMAALNNADTICTLLKKYASISHYEPQLSLDLLAGAVAREEWEIHKADFMLLVQKELTVRGIENNLVEVCHPTMSVDEMYAVVPQLMDAYWCA